MPVLQAGLTRLVLRPFTFSNGVTIPVGTIVAAPSKAIYMDEEIYSNSEQFDGFRFSKLSDLDGGDAETKYQAVNTSPEHLVFGFGRHAW
jgi:cytochrome P450